MQPSDVSLKQRNESTAFIKLECAKLCELKQDYILAIDLLCEAAEFYGANTQDNTLEDLKHLLSLIKTNEHRFDATKSLLRVHTNSHSPSRFLIMLHSNLPS
jgi:hypothetical protein